MSVVPELFILHIGHVVIISILKCFCDASTISLLVLSQTDDTIDNCEDDTNGGRYDLQLGLAFQLAKKIDDTDSNNPTGSIKRFLLFQEDQRTDKVS